MTSRAVHPAPLLEAVFRAVAAGPMADVPLCNAALAVEAVGFRLAPDGHWIGALVTPWAVNLLRLPGEAGDWPVAAAGSKVDWRFPSGDYEFTIAEEATLGRYHLCSLFSPAGEFDSHEAARLTALAAVEALLQPPLAAAPAVAPAASRRAFLGLGR